MTLLEILGLAKKANASATVLRKALDDIAIEVLERHAEGLELKRREVLLEGDDAALEKIEAELASANRAVERGYAAKDRLEARLAEAEAAELSGNRQATYDEAKAAADAAARKLRTDYAKHARALAALIEDIAVADALVEQANKALPAGAERLWQVEALVRDVPLVPDEIVSEEEVELWAYEHSGDPYPEDRQHEIEASAISGYGCRPGVQMSAQFVKRLFSKQTVLPGEYAKPGPRMAQMDLPGLKAGDPPFWRGDDRMPVWRVLARAKDFEAAQKAGPAKRRPKVQYIAVERATPTEEQETEIGSRGGGGRSSVLMPS
jgi:hypothetical protein